VTHIPRYVSRAATVNLTAAPLGYTPIQLPEPPASRAWGRPYSAQVPLIVTNVWDGYTLTFLNQTGITTFYDGSGNGNPHPQHEWPGWVETTVHDNTLIVRSEYDQWGTGDMKFEFRPLSLPELAMPGSFNLPTTASVISAGNSLDLIGDSGGTFGQRSPDRLYGSTNGNARVGIIRQHNSAKSHFYVHAATASQGALKNAFYHPLYANGAPELTVTHPSADGFNNTFISWYHGNSGDYSGNPDAYRSHLIRWKEAPFSPENAAGYSNENEFYEVFLGDPTDDALWTGDGTNFGNSRISPNGFWRILGTPTGLLATYQFNFPTKIATAFHFNAEMSQYTKYVITIPEEFEEVETVAMHIDHLNNMWLIGDYLDDDHGYLARSYKLTAEGGGGGSPETYIGQILLLSSL
jgi:hypothetical protein